MKIILDAKNWRKKYKLINYCPKEIFRDSKSKSDSLFSLSFFIMIMATEILFNQPFGKKIGIIHNNIYQKVFKKKYEKLVRVETHTFGYSFLLILEKLFKEEQSLQNYVKEIINFATCHWATIIKFNEKERLRRLEIFYSMWKENKKLVLSFKDESKIDLIFFLYKSFELGISNKGIIKKNISVVNFSVSKAKKEFRFDVLREFKKNFH
tara:strand:+ start:61 stop:687 length:627 start_codon:yes stop_codon:yes gene_type:complete